MSYIFLSLDKHRKGKIANQNIYHRKDGEISHFHHRKKTLISDYPNFFTI